MLMYWYIKNEDIRTKEKVCQKYYEEMYTTVDIAGGQDFYI